MITEPTILDMVLRLAAATLFGAALGWERKQSQKRVGSRTLVITSIGAAAFVMLGLVLTANAEGGSVNADPTRVLSYIVVGVGFLGGGMIVQHRGTVHGMTTGATFWVTAAIGAACGLGEFVLATMLTVICFVVLTLPAKEPDEASESEPEGGSDSGSGAGSGS